MFANLKFSNVVTGGAASALPLLGSNTHTDPINAPAISAANQIAMATAAGLDILRLDVSWQTIEAVAGTYDFSHYDATVNGLLGAGKKVLLMLGYGNSNYTAGAGNPPNGTAGYTAYTNAAKALMSHYPTAYLEIENEPNLDQFWNGANNPAQFAALVTAAAAGVKASTPAVKVITGGLSSTNYPTPVTYATTFMGDVTTTNVDGWAFHPYVNRTPSNGLAQNGPEFGLTMDNAIFAVMTGKEKWITEVGFPLGWVADLNEQARFDARTYLVSIRAGAKGHIHYDLANDGPNQSDDEQTYGLFDYQYNIKPAGKAYQSLAAIKAACVTYDAGVVPGMLSGAVFYKSAGKSYLIVSEKLAMNFVRDVGAYTSVSAVDVLGNAIPVTKVSGNVVRVPVSPANSPVILNVA